MIKGKKNIKITGIYGLFCLDTDKCLYVGQSSDIIQRVKRHRSNLIANSHKRSDMQELFNKNSSYFYYLILEKCENTDYDKNRCEIKWFNILNPLFYGSVPSVNNKWSHSESTKEKISNSLSGKAQSQNSNTHFECGICETHCIKERNLCTVCTVLLENNFGNICFNNDKNHYHELVENKCDICENKCHNVIPICFKCFGKVKTIKKNYQRRVVMEGKTNELKENIIRLHKNGMGKSAISRITKSYYDFVSKTIDEYKSKKYENIYPPDQEVRKNKIISMYKEGKSLREIALYFDISHTSVYKVIKDSNANIKRNISQIDSHDIEEIIKLHKNGLSSPQISQKLGFSSSSVRRVLLKNNISSSDERYERDTEIINLCKSGLSNKDISRNFNLSERSARAILHKNGIKRPKSSSKKPNNTLDIK